jgi:translation initiation factor 2B subunit (eIF-2B alpha/beta/delta family)
MPSLAERAAAIAGDRERGASALAAELTLVLDAALRAGRENTIAVARVVCAGQPAMASLWNLCAAAVAEFDEPGQYDRRRQEVERAPQALVRVSVAWLRDALEDVAVRMAAFRSQSPVEGARTGDGVARVLTVSFSGSVARTLAALADQRPLDVVCAESLPGGEGAQLVHVLTSAGVSARAVPDASMASHLPTASAVIVGADAVSSHDWTNKVGTLALAAAAGVLHRPVYVIASRDKAASDALDHRLDTSIPFERTPAHLATAFLTDVGVLQPDDLPAFASRSAADISRLLEALS